MSGRSMTKYSGQGIYSVAEASSLTEVSVGRIRRWLRGYTFEYEGDRRVSPPVWQRQLPDVGGLLALGFRDLIEVRFVDAFRRFGVGWRTIRLAAERARTEFGNTHPFSTRRFVTDGRSVFFFVHAETDDPKLIDIVTDQYVFKRILSPYLKGLEYDGREDLLRRWWPLGQRRQIVLDPNRAFGQPIVAREGVPTAVLANAYRSEQSVEGVAKWFDVSVSAVSDAIEFESRRAA